MKKIKLKIAIILFLFINVLVGTASIKGYFEASTFFEQIFYVLLTMFHFVIFTVVGIKALIYFQDYDAQEKKE